MIRRKSILVMLVLMLVLAMMVPAYAATVREGVPAGTDGTDTNVTTGAANGSSHPGDIVSNKVNQVTNELIDTSVTTDKIVNKLESKGNDIVSILQTVGKYVCITIFIVSCMLALVGLFGNHRLLTASIIGLVLSGVAYAGITCGREVVNFIATWAAS